MPLFAIPGTTEEYFETYSYVNLPFSMLSVNSQDTWHHYLYFAETSVATLFQQFFVFFKDLAAATV